MIHIQCVCQINYEHNDLRRKFCTCACVFLSIFLGSAIVCATWKLVHWSIDSDSSRCFSHLFVIIFFHFLFALLFVVKVVPLDFMTFNRQKKTQTRLYVMDSSNGFSSATNRFFASNENIETFGMSSLLVNEIWALLNWKRFPRQVVINLLYL